MRKNGVEELSELLYVKHEYWMRLWKTEPNHMYHEIILYANFVFYNFHIYVFENRSSDQKSKPSHWW